MATRTYYILVPDGHGGTTRQLVNEAVPDPTPTELNAADLHAKALAALDTNVAFLAVASPSNAQVLAQVRVLTRECTALIRLLLGALDVTDGT